MQNATLIHEGVVVINTTADDDWIVTGHAHELCRATRMRLHRQVVFRIAIDKAFVFKFEVRIRITVTAGHFRILQMDGQLGWLDGQRTFLEVDFIIWIQDQRALSDRIRSCIFAWNTFDGTTEGVIADQSVTDDFKCEFRIVVAISLLVSSSGHDNCTRMHPHGALPRYRFVVFQIIRNECPCVWFFTGGRHVVAIIPNKRSGNITVAIRIRYRSCQFGIV